MRATVSCMLVAKGDAVRAVGHQCPDGCMTTSPLGDRRAISFRRAEVTARGLGSSPAGLQPATVDRTLISLRGIPANRARRGRSGGRAPSRKLLDEGEVVSVSGFAVKSRLLVPWLILFACLSAAVTPALARDGVDPGAPGRDDAQQQVKDSTARYRQAKAELNRLAAEVAAMEARLAGVDQQQ